MVKDLLFHFPLKHLEPRECFVTLTPTLVSTILGSCVAITIFDPVICVGGISHAFLPVLEEYPEDDAEACRFVDSSIYHLLSQLRRHRVDQSRLEVKIFGGSEVLLPAEANTLAAHGHIRQTVGSRNVTVARQVLASHGLRVTAQDVGGNQGRKLFFLTHTGGVWIKRLRRTETD